MDNSIKGNKNLMLNKLSRIAGIYGIISYFLMGLVSLNGCSDGGAAGVVNIADYGARSGEICDTAILNAIIAANGERAIYVPEGTFYISKPIIIPSDTFINGASREKSVLKLHEKICENDFPKCRMIISENPASNIKITNITLDGNIGLTHGLAIDFKGVSSSEITNVDIIDFSSHGITLNEGSNSNRIALCKVIRVGQFGISVFSDGHYNYIEDNTIEDSGQGIVIDDCTTGGEHLPSSHNTISGNNVVNCYFGIIVEGSNDNRVENNSLINKNGGLVAIDVWAGGYDGVARPLGSDNVIRNNRIDYVKSQYLMRIMGKRVLIENNLMNGAIYDGIFVRSIRDWDLSSDVNSEIKVVNNEISNTGRWGIMIEECTDCEIIGNSINGAGDSGVMIRASYETGINALKVQSTKIINSGMHGIQITTVDGNTIKDIFIQDNLIQKAGYNTPQKYSAIHASEGLLYNISKLNILNNAYESGGFTLYGTYIGYDIEGYNVAGNNNNGLPDYLWTIGTVSN